VSNVNQSPCVTTYLYLSKKPAIPAILDTVISLPTHFPRNYQDGPALKLSTNLYDIYHCWVYSE